MTKIRNAQKILGLVLMIVFDLMAIPYIGMADDMAQAPNIDRIVDEENLSVFGIKNLLINDMAIDEAGQIYLAGEDSNNRPIIMCLSSKGERIWIDIAQENIQLQDIEMNGQNELYVAEYTRNGNDRTTVLEKWKYNGQSIEKEQMTQMKGQPLGLWRDQNGLLIFRYDGANKSYLSKLNENGNAEWEVHYNDPIVYVRDVIPVSDGYLAIGYNADNYESESCGFCERISIDGITDWIMEFEVGTELSKGEVLSNGNFALVGSKLLNHREYGYFVEVQNDQVVEERTFEDMGIKEITGVVAAKDQTILSGKYRNEKCAIALLCFDPELQIRNIATDYSLIEESYLLQSNNQVILGLSGRSWNLY